MNRWNGYLEPGIVYHYLEIPGSQICNRVRSPPRKAAVAGILIHGYIGIFQYNFETPGPTVYDMHMF